MRRSFVSSLMGVAAPPPAWRRHGSIVFTVQGVFNGEELLSKEEFCIQPDGRGSSIHGKEEALLCSILFTVQGVFNREELLCEEEFCIQPDGRGSSAPGREEALIYCVHCSGSL